LGKVSTIDEASLERFQSELLKAGFEAVGEDARSWIGPAFPAFAKLTNATTMRISFRDGWPVRAPQIYVAGLRGDHVNASGEVCLWQRNAFDFTWTTLGGLETRLNEWVARAEQGFAAEDAVLDAHLYFSTITLDLAVFDLMELLHSRELDGDTQKIHVTETRGIAHFLKRNCGPSSAVRGRIYYRSEVDEIPTDLESFKNVLTRNQGVNLDRLIKQTTQSGQEQCFALLAWPVEDTFNVLALRLTMGEQIGAEALIAAPRDLDTLKLRAGTQATKIANLNVVVFGAGAIGSHLSLLLAESGLGHLTLVDHDVLRPGNVVRHVGGSGFVGYAKAQIVRTEIEAHAPWCSVKVVVEDVWDRSAIERMTQGADLVVDATGLASFNAYSSFILEQMGIPLVSAALFREGAVGRVQRQAKQDEPIRQRDETTGFVFVVAGNESFALEAGCSEPVNNAPPSSVSSIAALAARVTVDALEKSFAYPQELHEVYRPIEAPFDQVGIIARK
jgi:molybdopterin/thiamine biosynthesis adenylyltransferase